MHIYYILQVRYSVNFKSFKHISARGKSFQVYIRVFTEALFHARDG